MRSRWFPEVEYKEALHHAISVARFYDGRYEVGLEKIEQYGKPGYHAGFTLPHPENRSGFELRCEVVKATDPLPSIGK